MSIFFGGKDPFDDQFFTRPFGDMFGLKDLFNDPFFTRPFGSPDGSGKQITIEEINSDDEAKGQSEPRKELVPKNPNDYASGTQGFSFRKVSHGGLNGMYYTSAMARMAGDDGVVLVEIKEEDKTVGEALHTISRGIHEKGHSVTTKHNSDGRVDSMQTLHNLDEDELAGFEAAWKANADKHLRGWNSGFSLLENAGGGNSVWDGLATWGGWALPSTEHSGNAGTGSERAIKVVPVNIE